MRLRLWHVPLLVSLIGIGTLRAQQYTHVSGLIRDPSGAAIPGASVTLVSQDTGFRRSTESQSSGWYAVTSLQPGPYRITVRKEGFRMLIQLVKLDAAAPVQVDFTLELGSVQEVIEVTDSLPLLQTEDASVGTVIGRERIDSLPLNGRGLLSLLEFAPGTVVTPATRGEAGQFTAAGQRANANYFMVDGVSANTGVSGGGHAAQTTGGTLPGLTALGSLHGLASLESLSEFRVQTSTAAPEFGNLPGAHVLLSTRSGTNELHGSAFYYGRSGSLDANNWFANRDRLDAQPLAMHDFGATLGGPVRRNKAFFFLSYEGMRLREPFAWRTATPTAEARLLAPDWAQPVLDLFPLPTGPALDPNLAEWIGQYERSSRFDVASVRLDYRATARLMLFSRYNLALSSNEFTSTQVNELNIQSGSLTMGSSLTVGSTAVLELKLNRSDAKGWSLWRPIGELSDPCFLGPLVRNLFGQSDGCDRLLRFTVAGVGRVVSGTEGDQLQTQWQVLPSVVWAPGSHQIRVGLDYRRLIPGRRDRSDSVNIVAEKYTDVIQAYRLWRGTQPRQAIDGQLSQYSMFAQDTWRIHPRLTATFGLRWEYPRPPRLSAEEVSDLPPPFNPFPAEGQTTSVWQDSYRYIAPRVGVAYRLREQGDTVIRGGWGVYFDSSLSIATDLVNGGPFSISQLSSSKGGFVSARLSYGFAPDLRLPSVRQWNVAIEQGIVGRDVISVGYIGSTGRNLLRREFGGFEGSETTQLALATNNGESDYHGLHVQYRRPMTNGVQILASYAWSHSIDNSSSDSVLYRVGPSLSAASDRGSSDFDVRHSLTLSLTYETPPLEGSHWRARLLRNWGLDGILRARTGFPVNVLNSEYSTGLIFGNAFRPDLMWNQPLWVDDAAAPGGRRLNPAAFQATAGEVQGGLGRNAIRGFGMSQIDLALRREFPVGERISLLLRLEAFNLLNHANFADPSPYLSNPLFGESPSTLNMMLGTGSPGSGLTPTLQTGGARSIQAVVRLQF